MTSQPYAAMPYALHYDTATGTDWEIVATVPKSYQFSHGYDGWKHYVSPSGHRHVAVPDGDICERHSLKLDSLGTCDGCTYEYATDQAFYAHTMRYDSARDLYVCDRCPCTSLTETPDYYVSGVCVPSV